MIEKFVSIKNVIAKVYRDLNLEDENRWEDMIEWSAEAMQQIGAFPQYIHKTEQLEINNRRASLPCDFHKVVGIQYRGRALQYLSGAYDTADHRNEKVDLTTHNHHGYTINAAYINLNFDPSEENSSAPRELLMAYIAIPVDEDGFPSVPDDVSYTEAITKYIVMKLKYPEFVMGTINPNTWDRIVNDWHWYCSQARGKANMPNADKMESIKNMWNRLKPQMAEHSNFFRSLSNSERITRQYGNR